MNTLSKLILAPYKTTLYYLRNNCVKCNVKYNVICKLTHLEDVEHSTSGQSTQTDSTETSSVPKQRTHSLCRFLFLSLPLSLWFLFSLSTSFSPTVFADSSLLWSSADYPIIALQPMWAVCQCATAVVVALLRRVALRENRRRSISIAPSGRVALRWASQWQNVQVMGSIRLRTGD